MTVSAVPDYYLSAISVGSGGADRENGNSGFFGKVHGLGAMGGRKRSEVGDQMFGSYIISGIHLCNLWLKWLEAWIPCILCILSLNGSILESTNRFDHRLHRYDPDIKTNQLGGARFVVTGLRIEILTTECMECTEWKAECSGSFQLAVLDPTGPGRSSYFLEVTTKRAPPADC